MNRLHFISGLPRSGSTLLAALLRQNPRFHAGMTGPCGTLVDAMLRAMSMQSEASIFIDDMQRERLLRSIFETFHGHYPEDHVSFDTNRFWCAKLTLLHMLFPDTRVICCVREVAAIVNSVEALVQKNALQPSGIFGFEPGGSVYTRADGLGGGNGLVGAAWNSLRQACYGPYAKSLVIIQYETLVRRPGEVLGQLYDILGEHRFAHDIEAVDFDADEFDRRVGTPGLHAVGRKVEAKPQRNLLPPELTRKFADDCFWRDAQTMSSLGIRVL